MYSPVTRFVWSHVPPGAAPASAVLAQLLAAGLADRAPHAGPHRVDALSAEAVLAQVLSRLRGQVRRGFDRLVLLDAGAVLAHGGEAAHIVLQDDPFAQAEPLAAYLGLAVDEVLLRLTDSLMGAAAVLALGPAAQQALRFLPIPLSPRALPPSRAYRRVGAGKVHVAAFSLRCLPFLAGHADLVVQDTDARVVGPLAPVSCDVVVRLGPVLDTAPGQRLQDAWLSRVPIVQCRWGADRPAWQTPPGPGQADLIPDAWVQDGVTGLICDRPEDLAPLVRQLGQDRVLRESLVRRAADALADRPDWASLAMELSTTRQEIEA